MRDRTCADRLRPESSRSAHKRVVVVGSGLAGLARSVELAPRAIVTLFERLPVIAGEHWEDHAHADLVQRAKSLSVRCAPGTQVIRWSSGRAVAVGTSGGLYEADALVVATGHRPRTRAESAINGARCGGVVAATVAAHLHAQRVRIGNRVVIVGGGHRTREIAEAVANDASCTIVGAAVPGLSGSIRTLPNAWVTRTIGMPRITGVELDDGRASWVEPCDAMVLADGDLPYRNVDGGVLPAPDVVFAQRDDRAELEWNPVEAGQRAAAAALSISQGVDRLRETVSPRIGAPR